MRVRSLSRQTDLIFARTAGEVVDRGDYVAIKTPSNPGFHWGNYLIFNSAPRTGDLRRWCDIYRSEFTYYDKIRHMVFTWDSSETGVSDEFQKAGFILDRAKVLTSSEVSAPQKINQEIVVRPLQSDSDWEAATHLQVACRDLSFEEGEYLKFKSQQMLMYRRMSDKKMGHWFGAFLGSRLVGDLGIFFERTVGRFQNVETHPEFRRQGICGTLVFQCASYAFESMSVKTLVMEADSDYHAARIYESVGFKPAEENFSLSWREN